MFTNEFIESVKRLMNNLGFGKRLFRTKNNH